MRPTLLVLALGLIGCLPASAWTLIGSDLQGWNTRRLSINFNPENCTLPEDDLNGIIDEAIAVWNSAPTVSITLHRSTQVSATSVADFLAGKATDSPLILCDPNFGTSNGTDPDFVPAATRVAPSGVHIGYGGVMLNAQSGSGAEISQLGRSQLLITLTHEMGHVLGLGHSSRKEALMYYSISDKVNAILAKDDLAGLTFLYPRNELAVGPFGCGAIHQARALTPLSILVEWGLWLGVFVIGGNLWLGRRLRNRSRRNYYPDTRNQT